MMTSCYACHLIGSESFVTWSELVFYWLFTIDSSSLAVNVIKLPCLTLVFCYLDSICKRVLLLVVNSNGRRNLTRNKRRDKLRKRHTGEWKFSACCIVFELHLYLCSLCSSCISKFSKRLSLYQVRTTGPIDILTHQPVQVMLSASRLLITHIFYQYMMTSLYACHLIGCGQCVTWYHLMFYWMILWGSFRPLPI